MLIFILELNWSYLKKRNFFAEFILLFSGEVNAIKLIRDSEGLFDDWFVEHIQVEHEDDGVRHFPLSRWLPANKNMYFGIYDSMLPKYAEDNYPYMYQERNSELARKQKDFAYKPISEGQPRSVSYFP